MVLRTENTLVDIVLYEHMCSFLAGGYRTSEGNLYLSITLENCLRTCRGSYTSREEKKWAGAAVAFWIEGAGALRGEYLSCDKIWREVSVQIYVLLTEQEQKSYFLAFNHVVFDILIDSVVGISVSRVLLGKVGSGGFPVANGVL